MLTGGVFDLTIVLVDDSEPIEKALRRFKKECQKSGILSELRRRSRYHLLKVVILIVGCDERPPGRGKLLDDKPIVTMVAVVPGYILEIELQGFMADRLTWEVSVSHLLADLDLARGISSSRCP